MGENNIGVGIKVELDDKTTAAIVNIIGNYQNLNREAQGLVGTLIQNESQVNSLSKAYMALFAVMQASQSINLVATKITDFASKSIKGIVGLGSALVDVGQDFEGFNTQLVNLFQGDTGKAEREMGKVIDLAQKVQGDVTDIISGSINLRLRGMDPFQMYGEQTKQELLQYAADLASSVPGKTTGEAIRSLGEAYAGQWNSLWRVFNVGKSEFQETTGHAMGSGLEGAKAMEAIVKYLEAKGIAGLQVKMSQTLAGVRQNIQDVITILKKEIADQGFFDGVVKSFNKIYYALLRITSDQSMKQLLKEISGVFNMLWKPIDALIDGALWLVKVMKTLAEVNPGIFKFVAGFVAITSVLLYVTGVTMAFAASMLQTVASFLIVIQYAKELFAVGAGGGSLLNTIGMGLKTLVTRLFGVVAVVALLAYAWKDDFAGIRTATLGFYDDFKEASDAASYYINTPFDYLDNRIHNIRESGNKLVDSFVNFGLAIKAIFTMMFNDNTITQDLYDKLDARGLLPVVENVALILGNFMSFLGGAHDALENVFRGILSSISKLTGIDFNIGAGDAFKGFVEWLANVDPDTLYKLGEALGYALASWLSYKTAVKSTDFIANIIEKFTDFMITLFAVKGTATATKGAFSWLKGGALVAAVGKLKWSFIWLGTAIMEAGVLIGAGLTASLGPYGVAIAVIVTAVGFMVLKWDSVREAIGKAASALNSFLGMGDGGETTAGFGRGGKVPTVGTGTVTTLTPEKPKNANGYLPRLPGMDTGGFVKESGAAVVHQGEVVLTKGQVETATASKGSGGYSSIIESPQIHITVNATTTSAGEVDTKKTARELATAMWAELKRIKEEDDMRSFKNTYEYAT